MKRSQPLSQIADFAAALRFLSMIGLALIIPLQALFFLGAQTKEFPLMTVWSSSALVYCIAVLRQRTPPWNLFLARLTHHNLSDMLPRHILLRVSEVVSSPAARWREALTTLPAVMSPWLLYLVGVVTGLPGVGHHPMPNRGQVWFTGCVLGIASAKVWSVLASSITLTQAEHRLEVGE